ncbi:MAG: hypothetical protein DHS20C14_17380 [Phycisphaeraceae bacterium]|nr:MAG: hypothetical protein DHS20C14_17380 [Phycisphaeraceae bacterium]
MIDLPSSRTWARGIAAAGVLALLAGAPASADTVVTKGGETFFGTIIENTPRKIVIRTVMSNIVTEHEIPKYKVRDYSVEEKTRIDARHEEREAGADAAPSMVVEEAEAAFVPAVEKRDGVPLVLEVPLKGTFGEDIYPKSVAVALDWAVANGVSDIVFRIDSPGGQVWAATQIVEIMDERRDDLTYHALVERGISASIWPTFACDTITMPPGSTLGGAVVYRMNMGNAEVDKKMNSIRAAELTASARALGHEPAVIKAMMLADSELYAWRDRRDPGPWRITDSKDEAYSDKRNREVREIDTRDTVLTLTDEDAIWLGVATPMETRSLDSFSHAVAFSEYDDAGTFANTAAEEWGGKCAELRKEIDLTISSINADYARAYTTNRISIRMRNLNNAKRSLTQLKRHLETATDLEMDLILTEYDALDHEHMIGEINKELTDLRLLRQGG